MGSLPTTTATASDLTTSHVADSRIIELAAPIRRAYPEGRVFDSIMAARGEVYRNHKNRKTIRVEIEGKRYFIKSHGHSGWMEIFKNTLRLRLPVLTAAPEWLGIQRLNELDVPTMRCAGYACRGRNPARMESFIITESLEDYLTLEELIPVWANLENRQRKCLIRRAIREIAILAHKLHTNGLNHRDFYLCHFMTRARDWNEWKRDDEMVLHLIDLHRMQMRTRTPLRWLIKDLSGLLFSVLDLDLTLRDYLRFLKGYWGENWKHTFRRTKWLRRFIVHRAVSLYRRKQGTPPPISEDLASFS